MASALRKQLFSSPSKIFPVPSAFTTIWRDASSFPKPKQQRGTIKYRHLIASDCQSLAARGFLRSQKPYDPPADASDRVHRIVEKFFGTEFHCTDPIPRNAKFPLLKECWKEFEYGIPNSQLHKINCEDDIIEFYTTPIKLVTPYDELRNMVLPPNLHLQPDYVRFDPQTDVKFDGITAYPESPTIITGLKSRKKYKNVEKKLPYYYYNEAYYMNLI